MRNSRFRILMLRVLVGACILAHFSASALNPDANLVPNAEFRGTLGGVFGNVTGPVPSLWRTVTVGDANGGAGVGQVTVAVVPLAAGELFPGSPPTNAYEFSVDAFDPTGDQIFDHSGVFFALTEGFTHQAQVYMRSVNSDDSDQMINVSVPVFDANDAFTGTQPGSYNATVGSAWDLYEGPEFSATAGQSAHLAFRLIEAGANNAVQIAMPQIEGPPLVNVVPNAEFEGTQGIPDGEGVAGEIPDLWRAFTRDDAGINIAKVAVPADELYPGSAPATAIEFVVNDFGTSDTQGFDHEITQVPMEALHRYWNEVYVRSVNPDNSPQQVNIALPFFDQNGFTGDAVTTPYTVGTDWDLLWTFSFARAAGTTTNFALRLIDDGGDNAIQIVLPRLGGPDLLLLDGFEGSDAVLPPGR